MLLGCRESGHASDSLSPGEGKPTSDQAYKGGQEPGSGEAGKEGELIKVLFNLNI